MRHNGPFIATAAWSIPKSVANRFPEMGSGLERYAAVFNGVEINSTFYRHHQKKTFARWASAVPEHFRFAVKIPREITHEARLRNIGPLFDVFVDETWPLAVPIAAEPQIPRRRSRRGFLGHAPYFYRHARARASP
jgi:uncharacterized protein YecE (DUF72 family)